MPNIAMTFHTFAFVVMDQGDQILMTLDAILLDDVGIVIFDADVVGIGIKRKCNAVIKAVAPLHEILLWERVRGMTVVAGRHFFMARMIPTIKFVAHDMTVHTRCWIIGKIGKTLAIVEGK